MGDERKSVLLALLCLLGRDSLIQPENGRGVFFIQIPISNQNVCYPNCQATTAVVVFHY